jgi:5'-3' exonuclease
MKINILFDSSFVMHRNLFSLAGGFSHRFFDNSEDAPLFVKKVIDDINSIVAIFPKTMIGRVIWARDSRSWRKDLVERINYKGTRVRDEEKINWDEFKRISNELCDVLPSCGFIVSSEPEAEADDLVYLWSRHLFDSNESSIIVTSDKDLNQCVRYNGKDLVCTYNPMMNTKRFTFHEDMVNIELPSASSIQDIFSYSEETTAERIFKISQQYEQEFVNPYQVSIEKAFEGDKSDNIPSALQWKKGERTYSFTPRMMGILMEGFIQSNDGIEYNKEFIDRLRHDEEFRRWVIMDAIRITGQVIDSSFASQCLLENISMMYLDREIIPDRIQVSNINDEKTPFDLRDVKVYEMKPEWKYTGSDDGIDSDIFSMMS